jgi:Undecaprenyl-phosphate galactose phosphotransferase WbaP
MSNVRTSRFGWSQRDGHSGTPSAGSALRAMKRRLIVGAALVSGDFLAAFAAVRLGAIPVRPVVARGEVDAMLAAAIVVAVHFGLGLYLGYGPSPCERFRLRALGVLAFVAMNVFHAVATGFSVGALGAIICSGVLLLLLGYYIEGFVRSLLIRGGVWGASAALAGCNGRNVRLAAQLLAEPEFGLRPVGFVSSREGGTEEADQLPLPCLGTMRDLIRGGREPEVVIFTSRRDLAAEQCVGQRHLSAQVLVVEDAQDTQSMWLHTRTLGGAVCTEFTRGLYVGHNLWFKRAVDLLVALPAALVALPIVCVLALMIKAVDPGPAFYVQSRVGCGGRMLKVIKLRTMYVNAERRLEDHLSANPRARAEWQRYFKLSDDPRILPVVGKFIRRTSLDELPQLWNILCGNMSLVGPRPFPLYHMGSFDREFQTVRQSVPPGLTGLWQVSSRSDGDLDVQKAQDLFYIRNWSILLDFYIILQTLPAILTAKGAK